jgi:hypothetical protein
MSACGGNKAAATSPSPTSAPAASDTDLAKEGETCGGPAAAPAKPKQCAAGLTCQNEANDPGFPGTCQKAK